MFFRNIFHKKRLVKGIKWIIPKKEIPQEELAIKVLDTLLQLKEIDDTLFSTWKEQGWSKKDAIKNTVRFEYDCILSIIQKEWDKQFTELGCSFTFWSGNQKDIDNSQISFSIGKTTKNKSSSNVIYLSFPFSDYLKYYSDDKRIKAIVEMLKNIWKSSKMIIE